MGSSNPLRLFDTHAHLDMQKFDNDLPDVIERAEAAGVESILTVGISAESSRAAVELAERYPCVYAAVGIHPVDCAEASPDDWHTIVDLLDHPRVVALGETGLDNYWKRTPIEIQQEYFDRHLRLAQERNLPIIIHQRESQQQIVAMLREARRRGPLCGIMHSFTAGIDDAAHCIQLGMHISFAGMVTFKRSNQLREVAATIPADRLLIETDSPFLSPHPLRGKRNEPAHIVHTANCLAEVRGESLDQLAQQTTHNARRLFGLDK